MTFDPSKPVTPIGALDVTRPVQTRDGRKARIICTDRKGDWPLGVLIEDGDKERFNSFNEKGVARFKQETGDLMNIPQKRWINLCTGGPDGVYYYSEAAALLNKGDTQKYIRTIEVEF